MILLSCRCAEISTYDRSEYRMGTWQSWSELERDEAWVTAPAPISGGSPRFPTGKVHELRLRWAAARNDHGVHVLGLVADRYLPPTDISAGAILEVSPGRPWRAWGTRRQPANGVKVSVHST